MEKRVLVTGANGFLGRRLCDFLLERGYIVEAVVRTKEKENREALLKNIKYIYCDLSEIQEKGNLFSSKYEYVFHLAWEGVKRHQKNSFGLQMKNVEQMYFLMEMLKEKLVKKVVVLGSVAEYDAINDIINPSLFPAVSDIYGLAKTSSRILLELICRKRALAFNYIILSSIYGEERDDNNIISYTIKQFLREEIPKYTKLEQIWNYIYIEDAIEGIVCIAEKGKDNKTYVLGDKENRPLYEYVDVIHRLINKDLPIGIGILPYRTCKVDNIIVDNTDMRRDTGFEPKEDFENRIKKIIDFYKANPLLWKT